MAADNSNPRNGSSSSIVQEVEKRIESEVQQLVKDIWRVGDPEKPQVPFGELFDDDDVQQHYEGLAATLKAAKKRGLVSYKSPILLKGAHDKVMVNLIDSNPGSNSSKPSAAPSPSRRDLEDLKHSGASVQQKFGNS